MVAIQTNMGIMPQFFFPEKAGRDYALTPYLEKLAVHREQMTIFSGTSHPGVDGAHAAERCFLTATPHPDRGGFRNGVSLDQVAAEQLGNETRFPSLTLAMSNEGGPTLSYTRSGAPIPPDKSPRKLFEKLFVRLKFVLRLSLILRVEIRAVKFFYSRPFLSMYSRVLKPGCPQFCPLLPLYHPVQLLHHLIVCPSTFFHYRVISSKKPCLPFSLFL
jgi:hypothetical protein